MKIREETNVYFQMLERRLGEKHRDLGGEARAGFRFHACVGIR